MGQRERSKESRQPSVAKGPIFVPSPNNAHAPQYDRSSIPDYDPNVDILIDPNGGGRGGEKGLQLWTARINEIAQHCALTSDGDERASIEETKVIDLINFFLAEGRKFITYCSKSKHWITIDANTPVRLVRTLTDKTMQQIRDVNTRYARKREMDAQSTVSLFIIMFDSNTFIIAPLLFI